MEELDPNYVDYDETCKSSVLNVGKATCLPGTVGRIKAYVFSSMDKALAIMNVILRTLRFLNIRFLS